MEQYSDRDLNLRFPWSMEAALIASLDLYNNMMCHTSHNMPPNTVFFGTHETVMQAQARQLNRWRTHAAEA